MRAVRHRWIFVLLGNLAVSAAAHAIPTMQPKLRDHEIRVGLQGDGYLTPATTESNSDAGTGHSSFTVGVRGVGDQKDFHFAVEAESLLGLGRARYHYLDIGELYAGWERKAEPSRASAYVGRRRYEWSQLDSAWSLGLYNPRFRWDYLNERENGIFGFFGGWQSELVRAQAYYSPIFIPEQGAPFDITGGNCHSSSPWFSCPSSSIRLFNQPTPVNFTLDVPPVKSLIVHGGGGASVRVGRETGPFGRASWAHKPMNQFLLSFEGRLNLGIGTGSVPAVISPRVLYHDLYSLDLGVRDERNSLTASGIFEHPVRDVTAASANTQEVSDAKLLGLTAASKPFSRMKNTRFEAGWLHRDGGIADDKGPFVSAGASFFEPRFAFQNAFSFAAYTPFLDEWARKFLLSTKYIVDTANTGNILVFDLFYSPLARLVLNLGADILGSNNPSPVDFISRYQRNDRYRGGVTYAF